VAAIERAEPPRNCVCLPAEERAEGTVLAALMRAALALPILAVPARAGAAEVGFALFGYKERGLMKVSEPIVWAKALVAEQWEVQASAAVDIVTGASPQLVSNRSGRPVQTITGASVTDRRTTWDAKVARRIGEATLAVSRAVSREEDYLSHAFGVEARYELNERHTALLAGFGKSNDRVRSSDDPGLDEPRHTREYLAGFAQVLSALAAVQSTLARTEGRGWFNDPYKVTLTFYPEGLAVVAPDRRPSSRDTLAWLTRYRQHVPGAAGTLQLDYRYYRDDWGVRAHTLELAWQHAIDERLSLRPALRYHTQSAADFYSPTVPRPQPEVHSSDQRLAAFGGLTPSLRLTVRLDGGTTVEATAGYMHNARSLRAGSGSPAFETLRAVYGIVSIAHEF
jgi:hypothetical protein